MVRAANLRVTGEDIGLLQELYPVQTPDTTTREVLVPGDKTIVRYRKFLNDWKARGWRLDFRALRQADEGVAYAIPCPDRRNSGNWVLEPVPVKPVTSKRVESAA